MDGSVYPTNPGLGGWGAIIKLYGRNTRTIKLNGLLPPKTTNNQAETYAVTGALLALTQPCHVTVYSDSRYFVLCFKKLVQGIMPKSNQEFWRELREVIDSGEHKVGVEKIRGHSGDLHNDEAHRLAYLASKERKEYYAEDVA